MARKTSSGGTMGPNLLARFAGTEVRSLPREPGFEDDRGFRQTNGQRGVSPPLPSSIGPPLQLEVAGVDPLLFQEGPPVDGQALEDALVRQPPIAAVTPAGAPGVADLQRPRRRRAARAGVGDLLAVVVAHRHDRMAAN